MSEENLMKQGPLNSDILFWSKNLGENWIQILYQVFNQKVDKNLKKRDKFKILLSWGQNVIEIYQQETDENHTEML